MRMFGAREPYIDRHDQAYVMRNRVPFRILEQTPRLYPLYALNGYQSPRPSDRSLHHRPRPLT